MAEIQWIKLSVNMFDDEKIKLIRTMPEGDGITMIWIQLLCLAGKINDGGAVYMGQNLAYSDEMLATILDHPINTMRSALKTLEQFELIEIRDNGKIDIVNWEKHQNIEGMDRIREQNRLRKQRQREKQKQLELKSVTSRDSHATEKIREEKNREDKDKEQQQHQAVADSKINIYDLYQANFGILNPMTSETLKDWLQFFSPEMIKEAMLRALKNQKNFSYAEGILRNWRKNNIKTPKDAEAEQVRFDNRRASYAKPQRQEQIPEYINQEPEETENADDTNYQPSEDLKQRLANLEKSKRR